MITTIEPYLFSALLRSTRTSRTAVTAKGRTIKDVESRRFFQIWRPIATRHGLYYIVKGRPAAAADFLEACGDAENVAQLRQQDNTFGSDCRGHAVQKVCSLLNSIATPN